MNKDAGKIALSAHARELMRLGMEKDVEFCSRRDYSRAVGVVYQGIIKPV